MTKTRLQWLYDIFPQRAERQLELAMAIAHVESSGWIDSRGNLFCFVYVVQIVDHNIGVVGNQVYQLPYVARVAHIRCKLYAFVPVRKVSDQILTVFWLEFAQNPLITTIEGQYGNHLAWRGWYSSLKLLPCIIISMECKQSVNALQGTNEAWWICQRYMGWYFVYFCKVGK